MLTKDQAIASYKGSHLKPDRLMSREHSDYLGYAEQMLTVYQKGIGKRRRELHQLIEHIFSAVDCPIRRIKAFCKLLDEVSLYHKGNTSYPLREKVFNLAAPKHPLVRRPDILFTHAESEVKEDIATLLKEPWPHIEERLFDDVLERQRLRTFPGYPSAKALLARYNVAQVQVALFDAIRLELILEDDFKRILKQAKLARLMHTIFRQHPGRYQVIFTGPASVLRETKRYGVHMAKFIPTLLACKKWRLKATLKGKRRNFSLLTLSDKDGLKSPLENSPEFDSSIEQNFLEKWEKTPREGWTCQREGDFLYHYQKVFTPDFTFHHKDGRSVYMEIVGFWTPEYLQNKCETIRAFAHEKIILAVPEKNLSEVDFLNVPCVTYKTVIKAQEVLNCLNAFQ